jgi:toxin FitB
MFILDTSILSAMMSPEPAPEVVAWVAAQQTPLLFTTSVSQAEILAGIAIMPEDRQRLDLEAAARAMFMDDFEGRVLPFDMNASRAFADISAARRLAARPTATFDLMIASIALFHRASLVTRDASGLHGCCGLSVIDPWSAS